MYRNDTITAAEIAEALKHGRHKKDLTFEELRLSSGFALQSRVDLWALNVAPSAGNAADAYEIKVSRSDFRRDSHKKQRGARLFSDRFWYVAPVGVIPHEDVPDWAGLIECEWYANGKHKPYLRLREVISAPKRDKDGPTWGLVVSLLRHAMKGGK
jgi:hypothetical protein